MITTLVILWLSEAPKQHKQYKSRIIGSHNSASDSHLNGSWVPQHVWNITYVLLQLE